MHAHVLQHVPFEGLGAIEPWLAARGARVTWTRFQEPAAQLPGDPTAADLVVALGGPMSVHDADRLPWLRDEQRWLAARAAADRPTLGLCLGAQLLAAGLGAAVTADAHREIGWYPVEAASEGPDLCPWPARAIVFHWHGETFALPAGAVHLARSEACAHQGFQWGARVVGLQCHPEATAAGVDLMVEHEGHELDGSRWVQDAAAIRAGALVHEAAGAALTAAILDFLVR